jgi:hypothetical protein
MEDYMTDRVPSFQQTIDIMEDFERRSSPAFKAACDMEDPADAIMSYATTLCRMAETLDEQDARVIQRLSMDIGREIHAIEELRGALFHQLHPHRERFERDGRPGETKPKEEAA